MSALGSALYYLKYIIVGVLVIISVGFVESDSKLRKKMEMFQRWRMENLIGGAKMCV